MIDGQAQFDLYTALKKIALAPNASIVASEFNELQKGFPERACIEALKPTEELRCLVALAEHRIKPLQSVPAELRDLIQRLQNYLQQHLQINPIVAWHLQKEWAENPLQLSAIDNFLGCCVNDCVSYSDLLVLFSADWGCLTGSHIAIADNDPVHAIKVFYSILARAIEQKAGTQSDLWQTKGLYSQFLCFSGLLDKLQENQIAPLTVAELEKLKTVKVASYIPIGYANQGMTLMSIVAIDYVNEAYRFRLLNTDDSSIHAVIDKPLFVCPEVIWEGLTIGDLTQAKLWKPLLELGSLEYQDLLPPIESYAKDNYLAVDLTHLVPWISTVFGKRPVSRYVEFSEYSWEKTKTSYFGSEFQYLTTFQDIPESDKQNAICLKPTGKKVKFSQNHVLMRKFVNLIPEDVLKDRNEFLLFKAESRLLFLTAAYLTLKRERSTPLQRAKFVRGIEDSFGKVTRPLEKLMKQCDPSQEQTQAVKILLASIADLKHRFNDLLLHSDKIQLTASEPLYRSLHKPHQLNIAQIEYNSIGLSFSSIFRSGSDVEPLTYHPQWTNEIALKMNAGLQNWYEALLEAKNKCEPSELIMLAHRNLFSKLPIPFTNQVDKLFPEPLSEGIQIGILLNLKKISSLIASEVFTETFVPSVFFADMARVYRFAFELYRSINPVVQQLPVSWYCVDEYLKSRHGFQLPGYVRTTLHKIAESFAVISPEGNKRPSEKFEHIPLFYFSWRKLPKTYQLAQRELAPLILYTKTVDEVLSTANLADLVGLRPEDTNSYKGGSEARWQNSFGGQTFLAVQEIALYLNLAAFSTSDVFQKDVSSSNYQKYVLRESNGPEDHLPLAPPKVSDWTEYGNTIGYGVKFAKQIEKGDIPVFHRMVKMHDKVIQEPFDNIPVKYIEEFREQAHALVALPKRQDLKYRLHQAASGPARLSLNVLLETFEARPALLLNADYRAYFWGILNSAKNLETAVLDEPLILIRFQAFIERLYHEDKPHLKSSNLNFERLLWITHVSRRLCSLGLESRKHFEYVLGYILRDMLVSCKGEKNECRLAPSLIAAQKYLPKEFQLSIPELARQHVIFGNHPPLDPNEFSVRLEANEAMLINAPLFQKQLLEGDAETKRAIWNAIFDSNEDIDFAMGLKPDHNISLSTLTKVQVAGHRLDLENTYLARWMRHWTESTSREDAWRENATHKRIQTIMTEVQRVNREYSRIADHFFQGAYLLFMTKTTLVIAWHNRLVTVDWETGRVCGGTAPWLIANRVPVHIRKNPSLSELKTILKRPLILKEGSTRAQIQGVSCLQIDIMHGAVWLEHQNKQFRLVSKMDKRAMQLPIVFNDSFTVWLTEDVAHERHGLIVAHQKDGTPHPCFAIDQQGFIRQLSGNHQLRLATSGYYPESQLFNRWGIAQEDVLVWLDEKHNVSELHIPLQNGDHHFTRVFKNQKGRWMIDGLDVVLESTTEAVSAFSGHPVYLVATNEEGQRLLLLSSLSPYLLLERETNKKLEVSWNQVLVEGCIDRIHQYRILPSGQVEGLTVADNLLLMQWTLRMGQYARTVELAKRWLQPPGRPYSEEEQHLLETWIRTDTKHYNESYMDIEKHPSALSLRLYVMLHLSRHMRHYPPPGKKGKNLSKFASKVIGKHDESFLMNADLRDHFMEHRVLSTQHQACQFDHLFNPYDHEQALRLLVDYERKSSTAVARHLYHRQHPQQQLEFKPAVRADIHGREIHGSLGESSLNNYFKNLIERYPSIAQADSIPAKKYQLSFTNPAILNYFDRAYSLIKEGPRSDQDRIEYEAVVEAIKGLRGQKAIDQCRRYYDERYHLTMSHLYELNLIMWLLLEQAYLAKNAQKTLPELPSITRRFGLSLAGSQEQTRVFFEELVEFSGKSPADLIKSYRLELYNRVQVRFIEQYINFDSLPSEFVASLLLPWPAELTQELKRWSLIAKPLIPKKRENAPTLDKWTLSNPDEWKSLSRNQIGNLLSPRLNEMLSKKAIYGRELLEKGNRLDKQLKPGQLAEQLHYKEPLSIDECLCKAFEVNSSLEFEALRYLEAALEVAHLQRAKIEYDQCQKDPNNEERYQLFLENLTTPHLYAPHANNLALMVSEYYSDCRLRSKPNQARLIEFLTGENSEFHGTIIQAIMGSGKSKMLAPMWLQMMLKQGRIPMLCVPSSLFRTTLSDLQDMMWKRFRTHVRAFTFERDKCDSDRLHLLAETLLIARKEPTVFVCSVRDLHALQLMLKERHQIADDMRDRLKRFTLEWAASKVKAKQMKQADYDQFKARLSANEWRSLRVLVPTTCEEEFNRWAESHEKLEVELNPILAEADLVQSMLNLFQHELALLVDEVALAYDPRNLLSFPLGWQIQANPLAGAIGCRVYFEWLAPYYETLGMLSNMQGLSKSDQREKIYQEIARKAWNEYKEFLVLPSLEIFTAYLMSDCDKGRPMEILLHQYDQEGRVLVKQMAQELAFLKYCLSGGLEGALTMTGHVNYGRSKQDPHLYLAIPYQCANVPKENTLFRSPWKTILMTCQLYAQGWTDPHQTEELIGFLQGVDPASKDTNVLNAAIAVWGRGYSDADVTNCDVMLHLTEQLDQARLNPEKGGQARLLIHTYLQFCVFPSQLKLDPSQLTSTPQDIPMIAAKSDAMGGTFGFETTWNTRLARLPDHSSDDSILKVLAEERNQTCHVLPKGGVEAFFIYLKTGALREYMALVDAGAIFKGISNEKVSARLLAHLRGFGFDCVMFYDEEQPGGARLAVMTSGGKILLESSDKEGIKRALSQLKLSNPFTYYDQARRIGADLALKPGKALVSFSEMVTLDDILQSVMRCRGLLLGHHSVAYIIPGEMEGDWSGSKVVATSKWQQNQIEGKANFHGVCEQLRGAVRAVIDKAMRGTADTAARHKIHQNTKTFLLDEQTNDLVKTFGALHTMIRSGDSLRQLIEHLIQVAEKILPDSKETLSKTLNGILAWHKERATVFPEWVREGESLEDAVQEVDLSKDQDRMRMMEEEYERMLGARNPKSEIAWSVFDPALVKASPYGSFSEGKNMPALFTLREALKERGFQVPIADNVLISSNLLATFIGETNCLVTENQKPVHRLLFINGHAHFNIVLVSESDARYLQEHLRQMPGQKGRGIYLIEPNGAINQRGSLNEEIENLWKQGKLVTRSLLLQVMFFQGAAMMIDNHLPKKEVQEALDYWTKKDPNRIQAALILFEAALVLKPDEMLHYRRSKKLRGFFKKNHTHHTT